MEDKRRQDTVTIVPMLDKDKLLQSIFRINTFVTESRSLNDILKKILDEVVDTLGFRIGIIRLFDESRQYLETQVVKNYSPEEAERAFSVAIDVRKHDCVAAKVATTGEAMAIEDATSDDRITETDRMLAKVYSKGSMICAPLKIGDEIIGTMAASCQETTKFYPEEINLFLTFANQMGIIIHNARLFEANAEKIRQLMILQHAVSEMNARHSLDNNILNILTRSGLHITRCEKAMVYCLELEKDRGLVTFGEDIIIDESKTYASQVEKSIIKSALDANTIITQEKSSLNREPIFPGFTSEIAVPFGVKDKFRGVLYLAQKSGACSPGQIQMLDILTQDAATSYDNAIMHAMLSLKAQSLETEVEILKERENMLLGFHNMIGQSEKMLQVFYIIEEIAGHDTSVLIQGASGTGKELIARALHKQSKRSDKRFIDINCAAIPGTLLESELFGYEAGAFTDAKKRKAGLLEVASGGTLLLDEIGEMSIHLQAKFLRMLEDGYIRRLGGTDNIPIDIRFLFSTNRDLTQMVSEGTFREDLYYRISVVPIRIPPLRERGEDILLLARFYVDEFNKKFQKRVRGFNKDAETVLLSYAWPGNVRELKNLMERVMILQNPNSVITPGNLPSELRASADQSKSRDLFAPLSQIDWFSPDETEVSDYNAVTEKITNDIKEKIISCALSKTRGNQTQAAKLLGISRYKLIREQKRLQKAGN
ncbi:MAG: sigma 54-interacting transcriptional regulator [Deltaproteobacteria bacterium]|nr:sigma 54-interacting transcriptional regulator [Deltaproteobacteria bacterium]